MPLLEALHLRRPGAATARPETPQESDATAEEHLLTPMRAPARDVSTPSPLMASTSAFATQSPGSTVRADGIDFELLPNSPPSRSSSVTRKLSKKRLRASANPDKRVHSLLPSLISRERSDLNSSAPASSQESIPREMDYTNHTRGRPARPPLLRRASSDPDLQSAPVGFVSTRRPSIPAAHFSTKPLVPAPISDVDSPVLASTPTRHFRRSRTPTQSSRLHDTPLPTTTHSSATCSSDRPREAAVNTTPKVPPRASSRPAHLQLQNAINSPRKSSASMPSPRSHSKRYPRGDPTKLNVQLLGGQDQRQTTQLDLNTEDGVTLILDCEEPLRVEYKTVAIPGSVTKRWVLHFKKDHSSTMPLSPPDSISKLGKTSPLSPHLGQTFSSSSSHKPEAVEDLFYTPTRSGLQPPARVLSPFSHDSDSPDGFGHDSDSDEGSVVSSPQPETPRPSISAVVNTPDAKQTEFPMQVLSPELFSPTTLQVRQETESSGMRPISPPNHFSYENRHQRVDSNDTVGPIASSLGSPAEEYYGDVLGIFLAKPNEEEDDGSVIVASTTSPKQLSLAERRGLKDSALKLGLKKTKTETGDDEVSRWSETESDDNEF